jgi:hypothetical protein
MVELKNVTIRFVLALILTITFGLLIGTYGTYIGFLIVGVVTGYLAGGKVLDGFLTEH